MNFKNQPIRNKNCLWWPCLLKDRDEMSNLYRGPSIDASYQLSDNLEKWFQRRSANQNKNCLWQPCLLMDRGKMINHYREPLIDASYLVSGSFGRVASEENNFKNQPIRNKNRLWWPCLFTDRYVVSNLYTGPSIDASYQVSDNLAKWFQRRRFIEIDQSKTRVAYGGHVCERIGTKWAILIEDLP